MRAVVQRVSSAKVVVDGKAVGEIGRGLLVLVGIESADGEAEADWIAEKAANLRVFEDGAGKMNLSVKDTGGGILLVPNFTVAGDARKGRRPSFDNAMRPEAAGSMFARIERAIAAQGVPVSTGVFRSHMEVTLANDGPVTIWLDSRA
ncbi:D-aminoacyl-tRNA deacylase [Phycisphaerales bacterium]|nr:D-aminoacyl-tRNA deacylase [Phycisphaerales bacterium]